MEKDELIKIIQFAEAKIKMIISKGYIDGYSTTEIIALVKQTIKLVENKLKELTSDEAFIKEQIEGLKQSFIRWYNTYLMGLHKLAFKEKSGTVERIVRQYNLVNKEMTPIKILKNKGLTIDADSQAISLDDVKITNLRQLMTNPSEGGVGRYTDYGQAIRSEVLNLQQQYINDPAQFVTKDGKRKNLRAMAEIKTRYDMISNDLKDTGAKYVVASSHPNASERCSWWQGKLFKVDLDVESRQMYEYNEKKAQRLCKPLPKSEWIDGRETYSLKTAVECGFLSYNCQHRLIKYYKGLQAPHYDLVTIEKKRNQTTYQRMLENKIRHAKMLYETTPKGFKIKRKNPLTGQYEEFSPYQYKNLLVKKYDNFCEKNKLVKYKWRLRIQEGEL